MVHAHQTAHVWQSSVSQASIDIGIGWDTGLREARRVAYLFPAMDATAVATAVADLGEQLRLGQIELFHFVLQMQFRLDDELLRQLLHDARGCRYANRVWMRHNDRTTIRLRALNTRDTNTHTHTQTSHEIMFS